MMQISEIDINPLQLDQLKLKIQNQDYPNIHSVLVAKNGSLVYEEYFKGEDQNYGKDIGNIEHSEKSLHDIRSISKSVVSICIGLAIDKGFIKSVDKKIGDFFPDIELQGEKTNWTVAHFLTMTTGLSWNEKVPYDNPENDEVRMTYSENPIAFVLNKPLKDTPGISFNYNGGATQILAEIVERSSNTRIDRFVNQHLFQPLGIEKFQWNKYAVWGGSDVFAAPSGLRLSSRDLLKIGLLLRNNGNWNANQIVSEHWVYESLDPKIEFPSDVSDGIDSYGYQFWVWNDIFKTKKFKMIAAIGNGGQNIFLDLENDLVVVTTAGNYNDWNIKNDPYSFLKNEIYPTFLTEK